MNNLTKTINSYKNSPSIIYFLLENKPLTLAIVAVAAFIVRFLLGIQSGSAVDALSQALGFASIMSASMIAILLYFKDAVNMQLVKRISESGHAVVFGLGEVSTAFLTNESTNNSSNYIIFEKSTQNENIEQFRKAGMGVVQGNAFDTEHLEKLNFETMDYAIVALGNDRLNIELSIMIIDHYKEKQINTPIKIIVHIINQDLNALFHQKFVAPEANKEHKIDIQTFSFYEEAAESFFENNFIDGESNEIMQSYEDYHIAVVGNGELAMNIIYQATKIAHLPNENKLHVHIVDKDAKAFKQRVIKRYSGIEKVVSLEAVKLDDETLEYFEQKELWHKKNLTHVIVCYDDEEKNIKIATDLFNKTYLSAAIDGALKTRINFAIFNAYKMSAKIDADEESFKQFFTFADIKDICTRENLLDEKTDLIAKLVHKTYADEYAPNALYDLNDKAVDKEEIHNKWYEYSKLSDKLSSIAQSKHIPMKLKALGLKSVPSYKSPKELIEYNRKIFDAVLQEERDSLGLTDAFLQEYSKELPKIWGSDEDKKSINILYFPKEYKSMLEKLTRTEHNRWNAFQYLNGWTYNEVTSKPKKEHACLLPLSEFEKHELQLTVIYDLYSILYIPNYLANAGYEIIFREPK
ncbi:MAG: NAD-binding protein [Campylobacterales bacterium]|nr:NAD-binding protein [Campylobacterales bacterium]